MTALPAGSNHPAEPSVRAGTETGGFPWSDLAFHAVEDPGPDQRWSTWSAVERGCHGPEPRPSWVVTDDGAVDTELGVLKTGKEADVHLLERAVPGRPDRAVLLAAKRYRSAEHRTFHRSTAYTDGRRTRRSRDARALARGTHYGREVAAGQWAAAEFAALSRLWSFGVAVPYPVQIDGTELLLELIAVDGAPAPRLARLRPPAGLLADYFDQLRSAMVQLATLGLAHGDLSAYNVLAAGERLVLIDFPQVVDVVANPAGADFLARDCRNVCGWFAARGLDVDDGALLADLLAVVYG